MAHQDTVVKLNTIWLRDCQLFDESSQDLLTLTGTFVTASLIGRLFKTLPLVGGEGDTSRSGPELPIGIIVVTF